MSIRDFLKSQDVWFQPFLYTPVPTASRRAHSAHVTGRQVAKTVLLRDGDAYVLAVLPATLRIDLPRLSEVLGGGPVALATEDEMEQAFPDCERGALPPFGRLYGMKTVVDARLGAWSEIVCVGNTRHEGIRLRFQDFKAVESPLCALFATDHSSERRLRAS
jgi:Ala-tRNA(Pro) deacylase